MCKKVYLICTVRQQTEKEGTIFDEYVKELKAKGVDVYYPMRDAPQDSITGYEIVEDELRAIKEADEIHVFWNVESKGSHFDLGMAYALRKKIKIVHLFQEDPPDKKTYVKAIAEYNKK